MNTSSAYDGYKVSVEEFYKFVMSKSENEKWELINGEIICLASPNVLHQEILLLFLTEFFNYFRNKVCRVLPAPMDVLLFEDDDNFDTVVCQPDLLVYCDKNQSDGNRIHGAPAIVIEIWSDSNDSKYRNDKVNMYKQAGVKEIWEVFPEDEIVKITTLMDNVYVSKAYTFHDKIISLIFSELSIDLSSSL